MRVSIDELLEEIDASTHTREQEKAIWEQVEREGRMVDLDTYYSRIGLPRYGGKQQVPEGLCNIAKLRLNAFEQSVTYEMKSEIQKIPLSYKAAHAGRKASIWLSNLVSKEKLRLKSVEDAWASEVISKWQPFLGEGFRFMIAEGVLRFYSMWKDINGNDNKATEYLEQNPGNYEGLFLKYCQA